jgi:transcriptional regulator with XRE-family HTH domain
MTEGVKLLNRALKLVREFHRMKQGDLAHQLGISKSFLSEIESGVKNPTIDLLERYGEVFEFPVSTLMLFAEGLDKRSSRSSSKKADKILRMLEWVAAGDSHATS